MCESWLPVDVFEPLKKRGAAVATLVGVSSTRRDWFVIEGQVSAVRQARRFLERNDARAVEIRPGTKPLYFAAELLATALPMPLFLAAQYALRESGISGNPLAALVDQMAQKMFKDLLKGARTPWRTALTECPPETAAAYLEGLRRDHPQIALLIDEQLEWANRKVPKQKQTSENLSNGSSSSPAAARR